MKSINKKIIVTILVIIEIMLINITYKSYSNRIIDEKEIENKRIAIKVDNGNNEYEDSETLPGRGYVLNTELTECLDIEGNKIENIKLDSNGENITITGRYTSYCTIYYYLPENREYDYIGDYQVFIAPKEGNYKIELWGASGGSSSIYKPGYGAYTKGNMILNKNDKIYIYVGEAGKPNLESFNNSYNGGGGIGYRGETFPRALGGTGGGATDIRLSISETGNWDDFDSLKSRIMVAAGGGAASSRGENCGDGDGGDGGTLIGISGKSINNDALQYGYGIGYGGSQTSPGTTIWYETGTLDKISSNFNPEIVVGGFGYAGIIWGTDCYLENVCKTRNNLNWVNWSNQTGGGGGYYGGGSSVHGGAGGGSSYISGHTGCIAIKEESTEENVQPKDGCTNGTQEITCSYHYSNKVFTSTEMKAGNESMPTHDGLGTMEGNTGNGYAKITFVN